MSKDKNPHESGSPLWQMFENVKSHELQSVAFAKDIENYTSKFEKARKTAEEYRAAYDVLLKALGGK